MVTLKTKPFAHQAEELADSWDKRAWGLLWEMGTGKTKPVIDTAAMLEEAGEIRGHLVLAPNGVHTNWIRDELPAHMPDELAERSRTMHWLSSKSRTQWHQRVAAEVFDHPGFSTVCMSYDAIRTDAGAKYAKAYLKSRPCLMTLDESPRIKSPGSKRTIRVLAYGKYARYRRILTGTIVDDNPFDVFAQIKFLDPESWKEIGCEDFAAFKATFGVWTDQFAGVDEAGDTKTFPTLVNYRNLDFLKRHVAKYGRRVRKVDVLDLPPKLYSKRYFDLTPEQLRVYKDIKQEFCVFLDSGEFIATPLAITRLLRLQQVTSGYLPTNDPESDDQVMVPLTGKNPRLAALLSTVEEAAGDKIIVWAKYRQDITLILEALRKAKVSAVRYDGACSDVQMDRAKEAFVRGDAQVFVSNPAKGGEGLTLNVARTMVYFNNTYKLSHRRQSEDRFHRIGQEADAVNIVDLVATSTVDELIIKSLVRKAEMAAIVQGDEIREWI